MAWSWRWTSSDCSLRNWFHLLKNRKSSSFRGVPLTVCCVLLIKMLISSLSKTSGSTLSSSMKMLAMRTESNCPEKWNCP